MKKILVLLFLSVSLFSYADPEEIVLNPSGPQKDRSDFPPQLYFYSASQNIVIEGTGNSDYYDVTIESVSNGSVLISTQVDGSYDTIDVSSLPTDVYCIIIISPTGNAYEGHITNY